MKISTILDKAEQIRSLHWMEDIASQYERGAALLKDSSFEVGIITICGHGDATKFSINPHHPISSSAVRNALLDAARKIRLDAEDLKRKIESE